MGAGAGIHALAKVTVGAEELIPFWKAFFDNYSVEENSTMRAGFPFLVAIIIDVI